ncbi:DUF2132 domain-containing protein [Thalassotalea litorea]|uniref:DUF2132 domain-containing protein n=1 Tax=Thalassotalea litorea TaxID=2020715 RepID=A0A5R9IH87_9GAMM|nr:VF530 family protein [Thalassotalea litorea]TLU64642.1 DUF2132 domain-containing protein [Thalassotalea litorea]
MSNSQPNNPLHGLTLEKIVTSLQQHFGWDALSKQIKINCFTNDPSIKSSLKFLRKTPWARAEVEQLYIDTIVRDSKVDNPDSPSEASQDSDPWADFQSKQEP